MPRIGAEMPGNDPLRIAFLGMRTLDGCCGGVETHVQELAARMAALGHDVTAFCRSAYASSGAGASPGVRIVTLPSINTKHLEAISHTALTIPRVAFGFDIVHIHAIGPSLLSWAPRLFGRKVVVTVHGLDFQRAKWGKAAALALRAGAWTAAHCPNATIVVSRPLQDYYLHKHATPTRYIPNGVNPPRRRPLDRLRRFGVQGGDYLLYLGRLVPEKGVHHLIPAFRALDWDGRLLIAGDAPHADTYARRLRDLAGDDPRVVFTGPLFGEDKDEAFSNARLFVLPSELEGMPIALLEAMSYGCPVAASDIPECTAICSPPSPPQVRPGEPPAQPLALIFAAGSVDSLADTLRSTLAGADLSPMGARARDHVLATYGWENITRDTLAVYSDVLAQA